MRPFTQFTPILLGLLLSAALPPIGAQARGWQDVWDVAQVQIPSGFYANYSTNEDNGREEFLFGHPRNLSTFGWLERGPSKLRQAPLRKVVRHLKSELRKDGYRMVPRSARHRGGRWSADFNVRSDGDDFRRRVSIIPVRNGYLVAYASSLRRDWQKPLADKMREIVSRLRVLD